jgi:hypothetical protein
MWAHRLTVLKPSAQLLCTAVYLGLSSDEVALTQPMFTVSGP